MPSLPLAGTKTGQRDNVGGDGGRRDAVCVTAPQPESKSKADTHSGGGSFFDSGGGGGEETKATRVGMEKPNDFPCPPESGGHEAEVPQPESKSKADTHSGGGSKAKRETRFKSKESKKGWREYRQKGGAKRYPMDRLWLQIDAKWTKKAKNRSDLSPMTQENYDKWVSYRAAARERRKAAGRGASWFGGAG